MSMKSLYGDTYIVYVDTSIVKFLATKPIYTYNINSLINIITATTRRSAILNVKRIARQHSCQNVFLVIVDLIDREKFSYLV